MAWSDGSRVSVTAVSMVMKITTARAPAALATVVRRRTNLESKAPWFQIADDIPQFSEYPDAEGLQQLIEKNIA